VKKLKRKSFFSSKHYFVFLSVNFLIRVMHTGQARVAHGGAKTLSITTLNITTLSVATLSRKNLFSALGLNDTQHNDTLLLC
jgi:hypothetical protein